MLPSCMSQDIKKKVFTTESFTGLNFDEKQKNIFTLKRGKKSFGPKKENISTQFEF